MELSLDSLVLWQRGPVLLNATILYTWLVMALLVAGSWLGTRKLSTGARFRPMKKREKPLCKGRLKRTGDPTNQRRILKR